MPHNLKAEEMIKEIMAVAEDDGIISEDEQALINSIKSNLSKYFSIVDKSYEDGVITSNEQHEFYEARKTILDEALEIAKEDEQVTQDEFQILRVLRDITRQMEEEEHY